jgi:hypothetical protein
MEPPFVPNSFGGKRKSTVGNPPIVQPHVGSRAVHEYQFLPEQPSSTYERASQSHYYDTPVELSNSRISPLASGSPFLHGSEEATPSYAFEGQTSGSGLLPQSDRFQTLAAVKGDYEMNQSTSNLISVPVEGQFGTSQVSGFENSLISSERGVYHDDETSRVDRKRKVWYSLTSYVHQPYIIHIYTLIVWGFLQHNEEAKIAKEVEAHERRIRKELEKQDILNRKVLFSANISVEMKYAFVWKSFVMWCLCRERNRDARKWRDLIVREEKKRRDCCVRGREKKRGSKESKGVSMSAWRNFCWSNLEELVIWFYYVNYRLMQCRK